MIASSSLVHTDSAVHILLVEDNRPLADWLAHALRESGHVVDCVFDGDSAAYALRHMEFDAVILDLGLPKVSGLEVLHGAREQGNQVPVLILTAEGSLKARIDGLNRGADDYLSKPFDTGELEARLRSIARRKSGQKNPIMRCGQLSFDTNTRQFSIDANVMRLPPREHAVLETLLMHQGKTVAKTKLASSVFSLDDDTGPTTIEVYVSRLRKRLAGSDAHILTLRGLGYLLKRVSGAEQ
jgi:two-component system response regulator TctD